MKYKNYWRVLYLGNCIAFYPMPAFYRFMVVALTWQTDITKDGVNLFCITIIFSN